MSVLIKGMEMPHSCASCLWEFQNYCYLINDRVESCDRNTKCPLVELPTPHGRLIDADELLKHKTDHEMISTHLVWNAPTIIEEEL